MYFPYFRGRQYELLALRELAKGNLLGKFVIPVIEPVKMTSTLDSAIKAFNDAQLPIALVFNPAVGDLTNDSNTFESLYVQLNGPYIVPSMLLNNSTESTLMAFFSKGLSADKILTIMDNRDFIDTYKNLFYKVAPKFTLFPDERQIRRTVNQNKVLFEDKFNKQDRNADYPEDEFFSEDHLFFKDEGYVGFGDYSIIGNEYLESGFAPYAVAIHIVYLTTDNILRIRHFISDSNDDISDVAGKFHEAVSKLTIWYNNGQQQQRTKALSILTSYAETGYYPGLPTIKKLSIMHHLELLGKYLDGGLQE
jgi:hypothetical protein